MKTHDPKSRLGNSLNYCAKQAELSTGYLYIVQCNEFVKIGFAFNVYMRVCNMQIGNPYKLKLLLKRPCLQPDAEEELLHAEFERYHQRGEWFKLPTDVLALLLKRLS